MSTQEDREIVRRAYNQRCGYCGVREEEAGSEFEIDHFRPRSVGGGDEPENLVYCCTACNRLKGDFWPASDPISAESIRESSAGDCAVGTGLLVIPGVDLQ